MHIVFQCELQFGWTTNMSWSGCSSIRSDSTLPAAVQHFLQPLTEGPTASVNASLCAVDKVHAAGAVPTGSLQRFAGQKDTGCAPGWSGGICLAAGWPCRLTRAAQW